MKATVRIPLLQLANLEYRLKIPLMCEIIVVTLFSFPFKIARYFRAALSTVSKKSL